VKDCWRKLFAIVNILIEKFWEAYHSLKFAGSLLFQAAHPRNPTRTVGIPVKGGESSVVRGVDFQANCPFIRLIYISI
jgi:hypothetical protein